MAFETCDDVSDFEEIQGEICEIDIDSINEDLSNAESCETPADLVANLKNALGNAKAAMNAIQELLNSAEALK